MWKTDCPAPRLQFRTRRKPASSPLSRAISVALEVEGAEELRVLLLCVQKG